MAIKLNLRQQPFAIASATPMLVWDESKGGLCVGVKPAGGSALPFAQMFGGSGGSGILKISIIAKDGSELPYDMKCDGSSAELKSTRGTVKIAIDASANALRFEGNAVHLRFSATVGFGGNTRRLADGAELNISGRQIFLVRTGTFSFDDTWILKRWSNVDPCLDVFADNGKLDLVMFELPPITEVPKVRKSFDSCVNDAKADFEAFTKKIVPMGEAEAYHLWWSGLGESYQFTDAQLAFDKVFASAKAGTRIVPKYASEVLRLIDEHKIEEIPATQKRHLLKTLKDTLAWWDKYRYDKSRAQYFVAYCKEVGERRPDAFATPAYLADLQGYIWQLKNAVEKLGKEVA